MKKFFFGVGALPVLALLAVSCAQESVESKSDVENRIGFNAVVGKPTLPTRAAEFAGWQNDDQINVNAYSSDDVLFNAFTIRYDGSNWSYDEPINQPGYALAYYAILNAENATSEERNFTGASFDYAVPAAASQEDLMFAGVTGTTSNNIQLVFNHLLSQVNFAVVPMVGMTVDVSGVSVNDVLSEGTYSWNVESDSWSDQSADADYGYAYDGEPIPEGDGSTVYFKGADNALMLLPQTLPESATFSFDYVIADAGTEAELMNGNASADLSDLVATWEPGKRYTYVIDLSQAVVGGPISFTVEDGGWEDYSDVDVNITPAP